MEVIIIGETRGGSTLNEEKDTCCSSSTPYQNNGGLTVFKVLLSAQHQNYSSLLRFDLTKLLKKKRIVSAIATLSIDTPPNTHPMRIAIHEVVGPQWDELLVTYTNFPEKKNPPLMIISIDPAATSIDINLTQLVIDWVEGRKQNLGLALIPYIDVNMVHFYSWRNGGSVAPILTVMLDPTVKPPRARR